MKTRFHSLANELIFIWMAVHKASLWWRGLGEHSRQMWAGNSMGCSTIQCLVPGVPFWTCVENKCVTSHVVTSFCSRLCFWEYHAERFRYHRQIINDISILASLKRISIWRSFQVHVYSIQANVIANRKLISLICFARNRLAAAKLNMETALEDAEYMAEELER